MQEAALQGMATEVAGLLQADSLIISSETGLSPASSTTRSTLQGSKVRAEAILRIDDQDIYSLTPWR